MALGKEGNRNTPSSLPPVIPPCLEVGKIVLEGGWQHGKNAAGDAGNDAGGDGGRTHGSMQLAHGLLPEHHDACALD